MAVVTLFIGTYTRKEWFVDGKGKGIYAFSFNTVDGSIAPLAVTEGLCVNPAYICGSKSYLYAISEVMDPLANASEHFTGYVLALKIGEDGRLTELNRVESSGGAPCHLSMSPDQQFISVSNYMGGNVVLFPINPSDGSLAPICDNHVFSGASMIVPDRQEAAHMHSTTWVPGTDFVYSCDLGNDRIVQFVLDKENKKLVKNPVREFARGPPGAGPRHMVIHSTNQFAYVSNELSSTISVYAIDSITGTLSPEATQNISTLPDDYTGQRMGADIHISTCGKFVFASNRGHDTIACFRIDIANQGTLELFEFVPTRGKTPRNFLVYDNFLLVANQDTDTVEVFRIDAATSRLIFTGNSAACPTPVSLFIPPQ